MTLYAALQTIIPLPDPPPQTNFTATSGDRVVLPCPIQPGALLQQYSVAWRKDSNLIFKSKNLQVFIGRDSRYGVNVSTFALTINPVDIKDSSENYQCIVEVTNPRTKAEKELQLSPQRDVLLSLFVMTYSDNTMPESKLTTTADVHE